MMMDAMDLSGSQNFDDFMGQFGENVIMPQNGDPRALFAENINFINQTFFDMFVSKVQISDQKEMIKGKH